MTFVNQIAEITHSQTTKNGGSSNKNLGEAFLLVWKYKNPDEFKDKENIEIKDLQISLGNRQIADMALFAFLKVITKINKYSHIVKYNKDKDLQEIIPDYKVSMGFGLNTGWAIEGAIGSFFKIDASYLSPNVNMAARLESSSRQYNVPLLVSGDFYEVLTKDVKNICREIDTVTVKGSIRPIRLFTVDVDVEDLAETRDRFARLPMKMKKREYERERADMWSKLDRGRKTSMQMISADKDFMEIRRHHNLDFANQFAKAYQLYKKGDFPEAHKELKVGLEMAPKDGPSHTLVEIIEDYGMKAPDDWKGYRALTSK